MRATCHIRMPSTSPRTGRLREMITSDEAERIATEVISPVTAGDRQGWHLEEFDSGWFIRRTG
jgi:hypothetical protein